MMTQVSSSDAASQLAFHEQYQDRLRSLLGPDIYGNGNRFSTGYPVGGASVALPRGSRGNADASTATTATIHLSPSSQLQDARAGRSPWRELQQRLSFAGQDTDASQPPPDGQDGSAPYGVGPARPLFSPTSRSHRRGDGALSRLEQLTRQSALRPEEVSALLQEVEDALREEDPEREHGGGTPSRPAPPPPSSSSPSSSSWGGIRDTTVPPPPPPPPAPPATASSPETLDWYASYCAWMKYYHELYLMSFGEQPAHAKERNSQRSRRCSRCHHHHHHHNNNNNNNRRRTEALSSSRKAADSSSPPRRPSARPPWMSPHAAQPRAARPPKSLHGAHPQPAGVAKRFDESHRRPAPPVPPSSPPLSPNTRSLDSPRRGIGGAGPTASSRENAASASTLMVGQSALNELRHEYATLATQVERLRRHHNHHHNQQQQQHEERESFPSPWRDDQRRRPDTLSHTAPARRQTTHRRLDVEEEAASPPPPPPPRTYPPSESMRARHHPRATALWEAHDDSREARSRSRSSVYERKREELANSKPAWR